MMTRGNAMKMHWLVLMICFTVIGCDDSDWEEPVTVSGIDQTVTINRGDVYNLKISGINNNVHVSENNKINRLEITGYSNLITIGKNTTIESFDISGSDNTVYVPEDSGISFDDSGSGNQLIEQ